MFSKDWFNPWSKFLSKIIPQDFQISLLHYYLSLRLWNTRLVSCRGSPINQWKYTWLVLLGSCSSGFTPNKYSWDQEILNWWQPKSVFTHVHLPLCPSAFLVFHYYYYYCYVQCYLSQSWCLGVLQGQSYQRMKIYLIGLTGKLFKWFYS